MKNKIAHDMIIRECREYLGGSTYHSYEYLRGKLAGLMYGDCITPGEYSLWNELLFMKEHRKHSYHYLMETFSK